MPVESFKHRWIPGAGERTILLLHGTGGNEDDLIPLGQTLDPAASLLSPRGRVDEHGSNRFFRRFAEGVFDQENMLQETQALASWLRDASVAYGFDPEQVFAVGFSNGANIGASLLLRHPELLRGAFLMRAMVPFEPSSPPLLAGKRVLISSGESDPMVTRDQAERLAEILRSGGADVEHLWQPTGHNLTRAELDLARKWLAGQPAI
ncbi:MAG: alpha/beta hydrolase [Fimbriimonadales bacterium]